MASCSFAGPRRPLAASCPYTLQTLRGLPKGNHSRRRRVRALQDNLGQLSGIAGAKDDATAFAAPDAIERFVPGIVINWPAIIGSLILFAALFVSGFGRMAGLDETFDKWMMQVRERRKRRTQDARKALEEQWQRGDDAD